jgi:hypothetical protein
MLKFNLNTTFGVFDLLILLMNQIVKLRTLVSNRSNLLPTCPWATSINPLENSCTDLIVIYCILFLFTVLSPYAGERRIRDGDKLQNVSSRGRVSENHERAEMSGLDCVRYTAVFNISRVSFYAFLSLSSVDYYIIILMLFSSIFCKWYMEYCIINR